MRMLLKASMEVNAGNKAIKSGTLPKIMQGLMEELKPEATYFTAIGGKRTALIFFDMKDSSQIPPIAERFFMELNAEVEFLPVMNAEDLKKGLDIASKKF
jgi:hypothetical protein